MMLSFVNARGTNRTPGIGVLADGLDEWAKPLVPVREPSPYNTTNCPCAISSCAVRMVPTAISATCLGVSSAWLCAMVVDCAVFSVPMAKDAMRRNGVS